MLCALLLSGCGGEADTKASRFTPSVPGHSKIVTLYAGRIYKGIPYPLGVMAVLLRIGTQGSMYSYDLIRLVGSVEQTVMLGKLDLWALEEGDYHAKFTCQVSTGEEIVFRELDFSY